MRFTPLQDGQTTCVLSAMIMEGPALQVAAEVDAGGNYFKLRRGPGIRSAVATIPLLCHGFLHGPYDSRPRLVRPVARRPRRAARRRAAKNRAYRVRASAFRLPQPRQLFVSPSMDPTARSTPISAAVIRLPNSPADCRPVASADCSAAAAGSSPGHAHRRSGPARSCLSSTPSTCSRPPPDRREPLR